MIRKIILFGLICLALPLGRCWPGSVYTWTDENGIRHFSNIAPPLMARVRQFDEAALRLPETRVFRVIRVYDGDTVRVSGAGLNFSIRLAGIDAPETGRRGIPGQPYAEDSARALSDLVLNRQIHLKQYGTGAYNRILAEIFANGVNINLKLVSLGMAEVFRGRPATGLNMVPYHGAEQRAQKARTGIWRLGNGYTSPAQWRKTHPMP